MSSHHDHDIHGLIVHVRPDGSQTIDEDDEDCDCPPDCSECEAQGVLRLGQPITRPMTGELIDD